MPAPQLLAKLNKKVFNPMELKKGKRPVIHHVGRRSGTRYRTPLDAHRVDGGFVFIVVYGADKSDWVQNVMAAGVASVDAHGDTFQLESPRIITEEQAFELVDDEVKRPPGFLNVSEYLLMDLAA